MNEAPLTSFIILSDKMCGEKFVNFGIKNTWPHRNHLIEIQYFRYTHTLSRKAAESFGPPIDFKLFSK